MSKKITLDKVNFGKESRETGTRYERIQEQRLNEDLRKLRESIEEHYEDIDSISESIDSIADGYVAYTAQSATTAERIIALSNTGIHIGTTDPDNVTTSEVPIGELYIYIGS